MTAGGRSAAGQGIANRVFNPPVGNDNLSCAGFKQPSKSQHLAFHTALDLRFSRLKFRFCHLIHHALRVVTIVQKTGGFDQLYDPFSMQRFL